MRTFILSAALAAAALPAQAEDVALLLGVERYENFRRVSGADDLVRAVEALRDAGFDVESATNAEGFDMLRPLERFVSETDDAARVVVGLSGRFYTDGHRAWLLAADARQPALFGMGNTHVSLDALMSRLARAPGQALLVLGLDVDADDSLGDGVAEGLGDLDIPQGVTVVLTTPSGVDDVLEEAARPGGDVMDYVRDTRRVSARGYQPRSLVLTADEVRAPRVTPQPTVDPSEEAWARARETNTDDSYRDFIFAYPDSRYTAEARRRLDVIESDPVRLAEQAEGQLNLTRNQRRAIQRDLTLLDFNTRGVDGIFGPGSRGAIRNWQQLNGFEQTSFLTREQINRIDAQASRKRAEVEAEEAREREEQLRLDRAYWDETGARGDAAGYRAYLERYPNGIFADEARGKLDEIEGRDRRQAEEQQQQQNAEAQERERRLNINPILARLIESRLAQLGFNPGNVDGRFDSDTRAAIARYQTRRNLPATGYLSEPTLARLLADTF